MQRKKRCSCFDTLPVRISAQFISPCAALSSLISDFIQVIRFNCHKRPRNKTCVCLMYLPGLAATALMSKSSMIDFLTCTYHWVSSRISRLFLECKGISAISRIICNMHFKMNDTKVDSSIYLGSCDKYFRHNANRFRKNRNLLVTISLISSLLVKPIISRINSMSF